MDNNWLTSVQALAFDKELSACQQSGSDCQGVIDKWRQVSDKQTANTARRLEDNPLAADMIDKELAKGGIEITERPAWLGHLPGVDVMTHDEAKAYVQQWNNQDIAKIDTSTSAWIKFAASASDPENQAAVASLGLLGKELTQAAVSFVSRNKATATVSAANKQIIKAAETISTAKAGKQVTAPRDLNEQILWKQVQADPKGGRELQGMNIDPRFPVSAGFQKMERTHYLPDGSTIYIHYQYNSITNKAYDMKIANPQRNPIQPGISITKENK